MRWELFRIFIHMIWKLLLLCLNLGRRSVIPALKMITGPHGPDPINLLLLILTYDTHWPCLLYPFPIRAWLLLIVPCDIKLLIIFIHVQLVTADEGLEGHIHFEFIVGLLLLLVEEGWVRLVLLYHHGGIKHQAVGGRDLHRGGQDAWASTISQEGGVEILAVIRSLIHFCF